MNKAETVFFKDLITSAARLNKMDLEKLEMGITDAVYKDLANQREFFINLLQQNEKLFQKIDSAIIDLTNSVNKMNADSIGEINFKVQDIQQRKKLPRLKGKSQLQRKR